MQPRSTGVWIIAAMPPGVALDLPPDPSIAGLQVDELPAQAERLPLAQATGQAD
jgi:hypothetical protein